MSADKKTMPYVRLGKSGLKVSRIILGLMQYGSTGWNEWVLGEKDAIEHIKFAYDNGIQTFDTANVYSNGLSEVILGNAIKKLQLPREEIVVMTKLHGAVAPRYDANIMRSGKTNDEWGLVNQYGQSRKHIFASVKASLERLQLDYIDLLQCHRFDYDTPIEETMQALHDIVKAGYVRYIGMSSCWAYQFQAMQNYAITNKLTPFISMQNHYNLVYREEEREMFPTLKEHPFSYFAARIYLLQTLLKQMFGVGAIPWSPLARGLLARPLSENTKRGSTDKFISQYNQEGSGTPEIIKRVEELAKKKGVSMAQVAIAWNLSKEGVTAPIVGTTSLENLKNIIAAVHVKLTQEEISYLEEPYSPLPINEYSAVLYE
ncbi:Versiconal hemiacetal acetate reductase [Grifola frondosa]|uniref:Versiconal hemiacetal acetate reductase n=1 Tax=Grifola frondosa TaxID=5627 RepID=A0A1C7MEI7_GRIFR|nr:Versiconal hemiacetal acetate reductase [Grifola frondosa]